MLANVKVDFELKFTCSNCCVCISQPTCNACLGPRMYLLAVDSCWLVCVGTRHVVRVRGTSWWWQRCFSWFPDVCALTGRTNAASRQLRRLTRSTICSLFLCLSLVDCAARSQFWLVNAYSAAHANYFCFIFSYRPGFLTVSLSLIPAWPSWSLQLSESNGIIYAV